MVNETLVINNAFLEFCKEYETKEINHLALSLQKKKCEFDIKRVIQQIHGLQIIKNKIPSWYPHPLLYPAKLSLEQCSSELTASYKTKICKSGNTFIDLTGGMGVDTAFMAQKFEKGIYIEQNPDLCKLATYNFKILRLNIETHCADSTVILNTLDKVNLIYIDPARRNTKGNKTVAIEDCTPNILELKDKLLEKADNILIKLSPMLDISQAIEVMPQINAIHVVSVNNECKELLFCLGKQIIPNFQIHCVNITHHSTEEYIFSKADEINAVPSIAKELKKYLYEPNSSLMKAGGFKSIATTFDITKLQNNSHLYTSDILHPTFPGRKFIILDISSLNKNEVKQKLKNIEQAHITTRNFPIKAEELRKKLHLKDGGDIYIFATTLSNNQKVLLICQKVEL